MTSLSWRTRVAVVLGTCGLVALGSVPAGAQAVGYSASLNGVRGSYPMERVDSVYVFNGVDVAGGPFRLAVTVPWMRVETMPSDVLNSALVPALPAAATGFGDPLVRFDLRVFDDRARALQIGVAASVKLPVVNASSGRGSGETDYAVGSNAFKTIDQTSLMADVLFWKYGDPEDVDFANAWSYSVGAAQIFGDGRWSALASVAGFSSGVSGMPAPVALNAGVLRLVRRDQSVGITASVGLNDGSSDFSVGASWRIAR